MNSITPQGPSRARDLPDGRLRIHNAAVRLHVIEYKNGAIQPRAAEETPMTRTSRPGRFPTSLTRRDALKAGAGAALLSVGAPGLIGRAAAQADDLAPYTSAKVN